MLTKDECIAIHDKNLGKRVWLERAAINDGRLVLRNADETLHMFMNAEWDEEEQAQAARLCAGVNLNFGKYPSSSDAKRNGSP